MKCRPLTKRLQNSKKQGVKAIVVLAHNGGSQSTPNGAATGEIIDMAKKR
ncbi:hypothetical protein GCM10020331_056550 [Ectobacillus funiculus]